MTAASHRILRALSTGCWPLLLAPGLLLIISCQLRLPIDHRPVSVHFSPGDPDPDKSAPPPLVPIWIISDHFHTGIVMPFDWLLESGLTPPKKFPDDTKYVCMSWGNQDAYSLSGIDSPWKWFRVLFTPTHSVMEMIPCNWDVVEVIPKQQIWHKMVERERGPSLAHFLNQCSRKNATGEPEVLTRSSWGKGVQLNCTPSYFFPRVCNVWTAQAIESMGYPINLWSSITANSLAKQIEAPPLHFAQIWPGGGVVESTVDPESAASPAQPPPAR